MEANPNEFDDPETTEAEDDDFDPGEVEDDPAQNPDDDELRDVKGG